jgi:KaiC/GvpD/RAD55 family RecA-like ATPase
MDSKKQRLLDATKKLLASNKSEEKILNSLMDIGVSENRAKELVEKAKQSTEKVSEKKDSNNSFWESGTGAFFDNQKKGQSAFSKGSLLGGVVSQKMPEADDVKQEKKKHYVKPVFRELLPVRVSDFDKLIEKNGLKRGDTILLSGGCGTGKTTFGMQSLYNGALHGEKGIYLTLEESAEKIKENMMENFGWDLDKMEKQGLLAIIKIDPLTIARAVEATLTKERGGLYIEFEQFDLPFQFNLPFEPDRVVVDSLSALSIAFMENEQGYRQYLRHLFETLEKYRSFNIVLGETEQEPGIYSRSGIEEFLADGVVVLYNIKIHNMREKALEILKLRSSNHEKRIIPYKITSNGMEIYINEELFREE